MFAQVCPCSDSANARALSIRPNPMTATWKFGASNDRRVRQDRRSRLRTAPGGSSLGLGDLRPLRGLHVESRAHESRLGEFTDLLRAWQLAFVRPIAFWRSFAQPFLSSRISAMNDRPGSTGLYKSVLYYISEQPFRTTIFA